MESIDLASIVALSVSEPAKAIETVHNYLVKLTAEIAAASEVVKAESEKERSPLEIEFGEDEAGAKSAHDFLRSEVFDLVIDWIDDNPGRTFHMLQEIGSLLRYLRDEVAYYNAKLAPKARKSNETLELKRAFNDARFTLANIAGIVAAIGYDWKSDPHLQDKGGKPVSVLPGLRGIKSEDAQTAGRYARVYRLDWTIDGEEVSVERISDIVRYLWQGADRIGKNAKDLTELLDTICPDWVKSTFEGHTFEVNGHLVQIERSEVESES